MHFTLLVINNFLLFGVPSHNFYQKTFQKSFSSPFIYRYKWWPPVLRLCSTRRQKQDCIPYTIQYIINLQFIVRAIPGIPGILHISLFYYLRSNSNSHTLIILHKLLLIYLLFYCYQRKQIIRLLTQQLSRKYIYLLC